ncbi:MAG: hypothetical protein VXW65_02770 [Pseudomonadota bacterium]|nr:hypothetical protein [Pseudomonadota bacterium]
MRWKCLDQSQIFALMDSFSIIEAAALIAGHPPSSYKYNEGYGDHPSFWYLDGSNDEQTVFEIARDALERAVTSGILPATIIGDPQNTRAYKNMQAWELIAELNLSKTSIQRKDLINWLKDRGCYPDFFFPENEVMDFMNPNHEHYSPKLAATVAAWEAANQIKQNSPAEGRTIEGKTVKAWATNWLQKHAKGYGVSNGDDTKTAFEQMAGIMNWDTTGGRAAKVVEVKDTSPTNSNTQEEVIKKTAVVSSLLVNRSYRKPSSIDDDLPF